MGGKKRKSKQNKQSSCFIKCAICSQNLRRMNKLIWEKKNPDFFFFLLACWSCQNANNKNKKRLNLLDTFVLIQLPVMDVYLRVRFLCCCAVSLPSSTRRLEHGGEKKWKQMPIVPAWKDGENKGQEDITQRELICINLRVVELIIFRPVNYHGAKDNLNVTGVAECVLV